MNWLLLGASVTGFLGTVVLALPLMGDLRKKKRAKLIGAVEAADDAGKAFMAKIRAAGNENILTFEIWHFRYAWIGLGLLGISFVLQFLDAVTRA